jgi:DNA-binding transcriptional ArsR family regulator
MDKLSKTLKALSDETRLKIIKLLLSRDFCVRALACHLEISEAAVSQHLKILRNTGLVRGEKRGYWVHYIVDRNVLKHTGEELKKMAEEFIFQDSKVDTVIPEKKKTYCRKEGK